jgi:serine O-acetyltransferase
MKPFARFFETINKLVSSSHIPASCDIGKETIFGYGGIGVVIHPDAKIGRHCLIGQGVTIGGKAGSFGLPEIEENVYIGPGAVIVGKLTIGHDSIIGANAVVIHDFPPYSVIGGVPARLINRITKQNFELKYKDYYAVKDYLKE